MTLVRSDDRQSPRKKPLLPMPIILGDVRVLLGMNKHHSNTVIVQTVEFGVLSSANTRIAGEQFASQFLQRFGTLRTFMPNNGINESLMSQMASPEGASFQKVLLEAILVIESAVAFSMHELSTISYAAIEDKETRADLIWECLTLPKYSEQVASVALIGLSELLPDIFHRPSLDELSDFETAFENLRKQVLRKRMAPSTAVIKYTAGLKNIPCQLLSRQHLLLGHGINQQQVYASMTGSTSTAAQKICADKRQTNRRLKELRLPVPRQIKVGSEPSARKAAEKIGFPVVIKPVKGKKGAGISVGITGVEAVDSAFQAAHTKGTDVIVEEYIKGADCRLLVIGGRFVAAVNRKPPEVVGDGTSTVQQLIDVLNQESYRDGFRGFKVNFDAEVRTRLKAAGLGLDDVLKKGQVLVLRAISNVSQGGIPIDVTDSVHPDNQQLAVRAATGVGLDVAGVDILSKDISQSYRETGAKIIEINARPGLDIHVWPMAGQSRNVAHPILALNFAKGSEGRIPVVSVAGDNGTGSTARILEMMLRASGLSTGLAMRENSFMLGEAVAFTEKQQAKASQILLSDPQLETLVNTVSLRHTGKYGLQLDACNITVIMDRVKTGAARLFSTGIDVMLKATTESVVVGAGNIVALEKIARLPNKPRLILVSERAKDPKMLTHLHEGGEAVTTIWHKNETRIVLMSGENLLGSFPFSIADRQDGKVKTKRLNNALLFAIAAAYGAGLTAEQINDALQENPSIIPETTE